MRGEAGEEGGAEVEVEVEVALEVEPEVVLGRTKVAQAIQVEPRDQVTRGKACVVGRRQSGTAKEGCVYVS